MTLSVYYFYYYIKNAIRVNQSMTELKQKSVIEYDIQLVWILYIFYRNISKEKWSNISKELIELIHNCAVKLKDTFSDSINYLLESAVEKQFSYALG